MRKTFVTAFVALLAILAVVSCDNISSGGSPSGRNDDGMVTVSVNTGGGGGSRSLNNTLAHGAADHYEVIFRSGTPASYAYHRTAQVYPVGARIKVPAGSYTTNDAIILLGRNSDTTLLATGRITGTTDGTTPNTTSPFTIDTTTTEVTFTVTSLEANISPGGGVGKAFQIIETSGTPAINTVFTTAGSTATGSFASNPYFQVPKNTSNIRATLTITGFANTGPLIIKKGGGNPVTFQVAGSAASMTGTVSSPADNAVIGTTGAFEITFTTPAILGSTPPDPDRYMVLFEIPVVGYANAIAGQITWNIRGGTVAPDAWDYTGTTGNRAVPLLVSETETELDLNVVWPGP